MNNNQKHYRKQNKYALLFLILEMLLFHGIPLHAQSLAWETKLTVTGQAAGTAVRISNVVIGMADVASQLPAPGAPPECTVRARLKHPDQNTYYHKDIRVLGSTSARWVVRVDINDETANIAAPGYFPLISWDIATIGSGKFELRRGSSSDGELLVDMKSVNSYQTTANDGENTQWFSVAWVPISDTCSTVNLAEGLNLICYPVPVAAPYFSYEFLTENFTPQSLDSLWHYDNQFKLWEVTSWDNQGSPAGDNFAIKNGEGYLVYSTVKRDIIFPGTSVPFETNLYPGVNLVSFSPPDESFTSYDLIQDFINTNTSSITAIRKYEKTSGRWYIAFCLSGKPAGDRFPINKDESYIVYMKKPIIYTPND